MASLNSIWCFFEASNGWSLPMPLNGFAKQIAVGQNQDGRLEIFYVGTDSRIRHNYQLSTGFPLANPWNGEKRLGGLFEFAQQIAVGRNLDGRLEIFYIGGENHLFYNIQLQANVDEWSGQKDISGLAKQVTVGRNDNGNLEIFYINKYSMICHQLQTIDLNTKQINWSGEQRFADMARQIVVVNNKDRIELFYIDLVTAQICHKAQLAANSSTWSHTEQIGGMAAQIAVGQNDDGHFDVFYIDLKGNIYHNWQIEQPGKKPGWNGAALIGGSANQIAVSKNSQGFLEIFYVNKNNTLCYNPQSAPNSNTFTGETEFGDLGKQIAVGTNLSGPLYLFYTQFAPPVTGTKFQTVQLGPQYISGAGPGATSVSYTGMSFLDPSAPGAVITSIQNIGQYDITLVPTPLSFKSDDGKTQWSYDQALPAGVMVLAGKLPVLASIAGSWTACSAPSTKSGTEIYPQISIGYPA